MAALHSKYRPTDLEEMVGHKDIIKSLDNVLKKGSCQTFLLVGKTGAGKTTLARIIAKRIGASGSDLVEVNASNQNSVDDIRNMLDKIQFRPMSGSKARCFILDECQHYGKGAWSAMLKALEEPPAGVYFVLCTTEANKVPDSIKGNRAQTYTIKPIDSESILELLTRVNKKEKLTSEEVLDLIAEKSEGSARRALTLLSKCADVQSRKEAARLLDSLDDGEEDSAVIELCRALMKGKMSWPATMKLIEPIKDENPESARRIILNYFQKVALGAKSNDSAGHAVAIMQAFSEPYIETNGCWPLQLSLGRLIL